MASYDVNVVFFVDADDDEEAYRVIEDRIRRDLTGGYGYEMLGAHRVFTDEDDEELEDGGTYGDGDLYA